MNPTDFKFTFDASANFARLPNAINYLKTLDLSHLIDDKLGFQAMFLWSKTHGYYTKDFTKFLEQCAETASSLLGDILLELTNNLNDINFNDIHVEVDDQYKELSRNHKIISLITYVLYTVNLSLSQSVAFSINFAAHNGLKSLLRFLNDDSILNRILNASLKDFSLTNLNLVNYVVLDLNSMSRYFEENSQKWIEFDALNVLLKVGTRKPDAQFDSFVAISNIATDKQIETLSEVHKIIHSLSDIIAKCSDDFRKGKFNRSTRQIVDDDKRPQNVEIHTTPRQDGITTTILTPLRALYQLAVNNKLRTDIYFQNSMKDNLKVILEKGNDIEQKYTLKLLCQLSFDSNISKDIQNDQEMMRLLSDEHNLDGLKKSIIWNLKTNSTTSDTEEKGPVKSENISSNDQHIMISYNSASRPLCLKVKSFLESIGHKVWIDVSNIHGASLDSMAKAVEDAYCVLICVTEKYRQSLNCQAEAQYAFKLSKHIIPLIMEKGYENCKGWLGIVMSDRIFINFTKYDYDECTRRLKSEIDTYMSSTQTSISNNDTSTINNNVTGTGNKPSVENWSIEQVKQWFDENKIDDEIVKHFFPCNGSVLKQLSDMRRDAPEFYFQTMNAHKIEMKNILVFTDLLRKLFN